MSLDLNYNGTAALDIQAGSITDEAGNNAASLLPPLASDSSVAGMKDIVVNGGNPVITMIDSDSRDTSFGVGEIIPIIIHTSALMNVDGSPKLRLETGTVDREAPYLQSSGATITFQYTVQSGDSSNDLEVVLAQPFHLDGGRIYDATTGLDLFQGIPVAGSNNRLSERKEIKVDGVGPFPGELSGVAGGISVSNLSASEATLEWGEASDNLSLPGNLTYEVHRSDSQAISRLDQTSHGTLVYFDNAVTTYTLTGLSAGTTYYTNVVVKDDKGNAAIYLSKSFTTLNSPGAFSITESNSSTPNRRPTVSWTAASGVDSYTLKFTQRSDCASSNPPPFENIQGQDFTPTSDLPWGKYYLCAWANNASGPTPASNNGSITIEITAPAFNGSTCTSLTLEGIQNKAVFTGTHIAAWGAGMGAMLNVNTNPVSCQAINTTGGPVSQGDHTVVWDSANSRMLVHGGKHYVSGHSTKTGEVRSYDPANNNWVSLDSSSTAREGHVAVWAGSKMIVFGGIIDSSGTVTADGQAFNPAATAGSQWSALPTTHMPSARIETAAVWTGSKLVIWGGRATAACFNDGAVFDPADNNWTPMATANAPAPRCRHTMVAAGDYVLIWGGQAAENGPGLNDGAIYRVSDNSWQPMSTTNAPDGRYSHTAVWNGSRMIVYGGQDSNGFYNTAYQYHPGSDSWSAPVMSAGARFLHGAAWDPVAGKMLVIGGKDNLGNHVSEYLIFTP
jgi:N-acetylneuraminic acid mutarotase